MRNNHSSGKSIESDMNEWLIPEFGEEIYFEYDIDEIPAIAERRRKTYENVVSGVREGIISRNEARDRLGLGEVEGGDDVYIAANLFPLGSPKQSPVDEGDSSRYQWMRCMIKSSKTMMMILIK